MRAVLLAVGVWLVSNASASAAPKANAGTEGIALVVLVDRAMSAAKIETVRRAVKSIEYYEGDQFGVIAFAETAQTIVRLAGMKTGVGVASTTNPTNLVVGLEAAHMMLRASSKRIRVVVVATDRESTSGVAATIAKLRADNITVSTVGVDSVHRQALVTIARIGRGRHYIAKDAGEVAAAFQNELDRRSPREARVAYALVIDRSVGANDLQIIKELARERVLALAPHDFIAVIAFDSTATMHVPAQRAANRMRIAHDILRLTSSADPPNTDVGLQMAVASLSTIEATEAHVILVGTGVAADLDFVQRAAADGITISTVGVREVHRDRLNAIAKAGNGQLQMTSNPLKMR